MATDYTVSEQAALFDILADEKRLRLLKHAVDGPVTAPELAETDDFEITAESVLYHLKELEKGGFLSSSTVQGRYKRPVKEFRLDGAGRLLSLEVVDDEYHFEFREPPIA